MSLVRFDPYERASDFNRLPVSLRGPGVELAKDVASLAPAETTAEIEGVVGGDYVGAFQFGGVNPQLAIEYLGPDGATFLPAATLTTGGLGDVRVGHNATIRLKNAGAAPITDLSASLT